MRTLLKIFLICLVLHNAVAESVWQDSFEGGQVQSTLIGRKVEEGDGVWRGDSGVVLSEDGAATVAEGRGASAWMALEAAAESIQLQAEVNPAGSDWTALALGGKWGTAFYDTTALWVMLKPSGEFLVRAQGTKLILKSGRIPRFSPAGNRVVLAYARKGNFCSVTINGEVVLERYALDQKQFTPVIASAGFKFNGPISGTKKPEVKAFRLAFELVPSMAVTFNQPLAVYAPGEPIGVTVVASGLPDSEVKLRMNAVDFYGRTAWRHESEVKVSGGKWKQEVPIADLGKLGFFTLHTELINDQGVILFGADKSFAVIPPPKGGDNLFGAMVYPHLEYSWQDKERDAQYMKRIGVTYVRTGRLNWTRAQASKEAPIRWEDLDREVDLYARHGLKIIATTAWPIPNWASPSDNVKNGPDRGNFFPREDCLPSAGQFMREMAARYRGKIACYEIGNETDAYFWLGRLDHFYAHDTRAILSDYNEYFSLLSGEIKTGDPQALVAPSTTSHMPEGHMYQPWLKTLLDLGMGGRMNAFATHYEADMAAINTMLQQYKVEVPVFFTEIGGIARNTVDSRPQSDAIKQVIRGDYLQMSRQLGFKNTRALCKFILREQPTYGGEGHILAGLLGVDFEVRPTYVAYATLIRMLAGASYVKELNVTSDVAQGWAQGCSFARDGQVVNVLFLNAADKTLMTLRTKETALKVVDVMGNAETMPVKDGQAVLEITKALPVIVLGKLEDKPGPVQRPVDKLVREVEITLENPAFEAEMTGEKVPGWRLMVNEENSGAAKESRFTVQADRLVMSEGKQSVRFDAPELTQWYGISQDIPLALIPQPSVNEYLVFKVSAMVKGTNVKGKGMGYTLAFRKANMTRLYFTGSPYFGFGGTFDWKELSGSHELREWVPGTERVTLDLLMGKSTGTMWLDQIKVTVQLWKTVN